MSPNNPVTIAELTESAFQNFVHFELYSYLKQIVNQLGEQPPNALPRTAEEIHSQQSLQQPLQQQAADIADKAFDLLTSRKFCYLSKKRVQPYRDSILAHFNKNIAASEPLRMYLDIGGGYHASLYPGKTQLSFKPGLGEYFILSQIKLLDDKISEFYSPGVRFTLVIDNISALLINDIAVQNTSEFCLVLRKLINDAGMSHKVDVLVESENFSLELYDRIIEEVTPHASTISDKEISNVSRFLGRPCSTEEALARAIRYKAVTGASERLFDTIIEGVHMTQRATPTTLCFRAYPGADSRIQCGEVAISIKKDGKLFPVLLTSNNVANYHCQKIAFKGMLPDIIPEILFAESVSQ